MTKSIASVRLRTLLPLAALLSVALAFQGAHAYEAKAKAPADTLESLLKPENKVKLGGILTYHVVAGKVMAADVVKLTSAKTVDGQSVKVAVDGGKVRVDGANVVKTDIGASNGVIHVIDAVLLPK